MNEEHITAELEAINDLKATALLEAVKSTKGKIFSVEFVKKDGSLRQMRCRMGVKKGVKGTRPEATAKRKETLAKNIMIGVYDMAKETNNYRTLNCKTIRKFKCGEFEIDYTN